MPVQAAGPIQKIWREPGPSGYQVTVILPENTEDLAPVPGVRPVPVYFTPEDGSEAPECTLPFNFPCFTTHPRSTKNFGEMSDKDLEAYISAFTSAIKKEVSENHPDVIHGQHIWILSSLAAGQHDEKRI